MHDYSILDDLKEGVQIIDRKMRYVYLNKVLLNEINQSSEQVIGHFMVEIFPHIDHTEVYSEISSCLEEQSIRKFINEFFFPDGRQTFYEINIQPIDEGVIIFSRDITKSKRGELLLRETNKELEHFAFISAHNLREPLKLIESFSELLLQDYSSNLPNQAKEICVTLREKSQLALEMINEFRDLSGIGGKKLTKDKVNILDMVREISNSLQRDYVDKKLFMKYPVEGVKVDAYPTLVSSLLKQLLRNAFQYGEGSIEFSVADKEQQIFCISNRTGLNLPIADIFLTYTTEGGTEHAGLGLPICKKIIDRHDGKIWSHFENSVFKIYFSLLPTIQAR